MQRLEYPLILAFPRQEVGCGSQNHSLSDTEGRLYFRTLTVLGDECPHRWAPVPELTAASLVKDHPLPWIWSWPLVHTQLPRKLKLEIDSSWYDTLRLEVYGENKILYKSHLTCSTLFLIFIYVDAQNSGLYFFFNYLQYSVDRLHNLFTYSFADTFSLFSSLLKQYYKEYPCCLSLNLQVCHQHV